MWLLSRELCFWMLQTLVLMVVSFNFVNNLSEQESLVYNSKPPANLIIMVKCKLFPRANFLINLSIIALLMSVALSQQYVVAYIFSNGIEQRLPNNSIRVYEKFRFDATVLMNSYTRKMYSNMDILKNLPELSSQTLMKPQFQGLMNFKRSTLPQHFWVETKQVVIIQVDLSKFPTNKQELSKYSSLFKQKGPAFYMINTNQPNQTIPLEIWEIFGFDPLKDSLCQIHIQTNTLQENTALIKECYSKSAKKQVRGSVNVSFMYMVSQYGAMALIYIVLTSMITCGSPYVMIWWQKRKDQQSSHV